jgi:hypothetical protein
MSCSDFKSPIVHCYNAKSINQMMIDDVINYIRNYKFILQ